MLNRKTKRQKTWGSAKKKSVKEENIGQGYSIQLQI